MRPWCPKRLTLWKGRLNQWIALLFLSVTTPAKWLVSLSEHRGSLNSAILWTTIWHSPILQSLPQHSFDSIKFRSLWSTFSLFIDDIGLLMNESVISPDWWLLHAYWFSGKEILALKWALKNVGVTNRETVSGKRCFIFKMFNVVSATYTFLTHLFCFGVEAASQISTPGYLHGETLLWVCDLTCFIVIWLVLLMNQ